MCKKKYPKVIFFCVILTVWAGHYWSQCQAAQSKTERISRADVGRDNPFAKIPKRKNPVSPDVSQTSQLGEGNTELFLETITIKSLDAQSIKNVIENLSSEYGSISADEKTNSLIICDTKENLERILAQIEHADKAIDPNTPGLFVETAILKFLNAKDLGLAIASMASKYGSITPDSKTNSLIICDTKENLEKILTEIRKADNTPQQIMIEVVIIDVKLDDDTEIGINWDVLSDTKYDIGYRQNFTTSRLGSIAESATTIGNATAFNTTGFGGAFSIISGTIRNVIHLIQQKKDVEILASPRVMMVSGQSAYIEAVEEIPYQEITDTAAGGAEALTSTEFKNVGVKLTVSATLTDNNDILLTVNAEQNAKTGESISGVPVVDTRKANTSLLLKDSQVVVLGGLRRQEKTKDIDQIPVLGDLPIIGALFRSTNTVIKNSELVVLLSPHIYKGEPIPDDVMAKYKEIKERPMLSSPENRDDAKKMLLKRIKMLQNSKDEDVTEELLSALTSLENILSQEMQESLNSSERTSADEEM